MTYIKKQWWTYKAKGILKTNYNAEFIEMIERIMPEAHLTIKKIVYERMLWMEYFIEKDNYHWVIDDETVLFLYVNNTKSRAIKKRLAHLIQKEIVISD